MYFFALSFNKIYKIKCQKLHKKLRESSLINLE
jgi:hypothetical protein